MSLDAATRSRIDAAIREHDVTLFMKGNRQQPQCGFSATVVRILDTLVPDYHTIDVLSDAEVREGIKAYSSWPTIPQLYVKGEFIGGCDIVQELFASGELAEALGVGLLEASATPSITIEDDAAEQLREAAAQQGGPGRDLHVGIDARYQTNLFIGPNGEDEIAVEANGVRLVMDRVTASRANGITISIAETPQGPGFRVDNPNAPSVHALSVQDLAKLLESAEPFELLDVRTPEERATAVIPGSKLMTQEEADRIEKLPRDTRLVFTCHHGGRSQQAAEHFTALGFTNVHNVVGGIEAWSLEVDPSVPRY